ncbi:hypothetical protein [Peribacillus simplex]|uniref:hypothetical protein n=1 Tax=Peribacillus simplex TaxID=1478 RepID=UPI0036D87CEF
MAGRRMVDRWEDDSKSFLRFNLKQRVLPSLYGGIIGDMLGVPVEILKKRHLKKVKLEKYCWIQQTLNLLKRWGLNEPINICTPNLWNGMKWR